MMQIIVFITFIYMALGKRLLQQAWTPPQIPTDPPQGVQIPAQVISNQPQYQYPPLPPAVQTPYDVWTAPKIPTNPPNQPQYTPIYNPTLPYHPINNPYGIKPADPATPRTTPYPQGAAELFCEYPGSCASQTITLYNVKDSFRLICEVAGTCSDARITLAMNHMSSDVEMFEGIFCKEGRSPSAKGSCEGTKLVIANQQLGGHSIEIEKMECSGEDSCKNMEVIIGTNTQIINVLCDYGQCDGCLLKVNPWDIGVPCLGPGLTGEPFPLSI